MTHDDAVADPAGPRASGTRTQLFTVRLWLEDVGGGAEYRGQVRHVVSGAFCGFRDWSELTDFMLTRVQEDSDRQQDATMRVS